MKKLFKDLIDPEPLQKYFPGVLEVLKLDFMDLPPGKAVEMVNKTDNLKAIKMLCKQCNYKGNPHNLLLINIYLWLMDNKDQHNFLQKKERDHIKAVNELRLFANNNISDFLDIEKIRIITKKYPAKTASGIVDKPETLNIEDSQLLSKIYNAIKLILDNENAIYTDNSSGDQNFIKSVTKSYFDYIKGTSNMTGQDAISFIHHQPGNFLGETDAITKRLGRLLDK